MTEEFKAFYAGHRRDATALWQLAQDKSVWNRLLKKHWFGGKGLLGPREPPVPHFVSKAFQSAPSGLHRGRRGDEGRGAH
eukprot:14035753-Alexandrium_andersonii.AAC.1